MTARGHVQRRDQRPRCSRLTWPLRVLKRFPYGSEGKHLIILT
jgi:hypothetical protein